MAHPLNLKQNIKDCASIDNELRSSLSKEDIETLRCELRSMSKQEWYIWCEKHSGTIAEFLALPPSVRRTQHVHGVAAARRWLTLAAIQRVRIARSLILHVDRHCLFPWAGGSSRDFAVRAAQAFDDINLYSDENLWPFDEDDPFDYT